MDVSVRVPWKMPYLHTSLADTPTEGQPAAEAWYIPPHGTNWQLVAQQAVGGRVTPSMHMHWRKHARCLTQPMTRGPVAQSHMAGGCTGHTPHKSGTASPPE